MWRHNSSSTERGFKFKSGDYLVEHKLKRE